MVNLAFIVPSFLILFWVPLFREPYATSHIIAFLVFIGFTLIGWALSGGGAAIRRGPGRWLFVIAALVWCASSGFALHSFESLQVGMLGWGAFIFYLSLPANINIQALTLIGGVESIVCLVQFFYGSIGTRIKEPASKMLVAGTLGNPEYVAYFLGSLLLLTLCVNDHHWQKRAQALLALLLIAGLCATGSRVAALCLLLSFGILIFWKAKTKAFRMLWALSMATIVFATLRFFPSALHSLKGRILSSLSTCLVASHSPLLGVGLGHLKYHYLQAQTAIIHWPFFQFLSSQAGFSDRAHNEFLDIFAEAGIGALGLLLYFFSSLIRNSLNVKEAKKKTFALLWTIFTFLMSLFSFPLHILPNLILIVFIAAYIDEDIGYRLLQFSPAFRLALISLGVIFTGTALSVGLPQYYLNVSIKSVQMGQNKKAKDAIDAGLWWSTESHALLLQKARLEFLQFQSARALQTLSVISPKPCTVDAYKLQGLALQSLGRWDEAEENYQNLERAFPAMITPKYYLGRIKLQKQQPALARSYFSSVSPLKAVNEKALFDKFFTLDFLNAK